MSDYQQKLQIENSSSSKQNSVNYNKYLKAAIFLFIGIILIGVILFIYLNNKQGVKLNNNIPIFNTMKVNKNDLNVLFISDIHVDPYQCPKDFKFTHKGSYVGYKEVSSCKPFTIGNMFNEVATSYTNYGVPEKDVNPPITALSGVLDDFDNKYKINNDKIMLVMGDILRHKADDFNEHYEFEQKAVTTIVREMKSKFDKDEIFYTIGNNGAEHGAPCKPTGAFINPDAPSTSGWAQAMIDQEIVNNELGWKQSFRNKENVNQIEFFRQTGYYVKKVKNHDLYIIMVNSMGNDKSLTCKQENIFAMIDCDRIPSSASVYILSHFCYWRLEKCITCKVGFGCKKVKNFFCGHKHKEQPYFGKKEYENHIRIPAVTRAHGPSLQCPCQTAAILENENYHVNIDTTKLSTFMNVPLQSAHIDF